MLQYLINATAIWLISLVVFDMFLRRESYHNYNRFYLLFTFLLGALLPLCQWQNNSIPYSSSIQEPVEQVITAKRAIVAAGTPVQSAVGWQHWITLLYLAGAILALALLIADILKLASYYRQGVKSVEGQWTVVTTGKGHAPFSFMKILFVGDRNLYSDGEWKMILDHEGRHTKLLHFVDLLLMQAARVVFWFHPLVYICHKRLLLVHEYQADNAAARQPKIYGSFLIEQSILLAAPSIVHSFNRSPIKNRIVMLTRRSSAASRTKMLVFIPLMLVCLLCFTKNGFSRRYEKNGNIVTWRGNTVELSETRYDTVVFIDPVFGKEQTKTVKHLPQPIRLNGQPIPEHADQAPVFTGADADLRIYLLKHLKKELAELKDGTYRLMVNDILIDETGKIAYFHYFDLKRSKDQGQVTPSLGQPVSETVSDSDPKITVRLTGDNASMGPLKLLPTNDDQRYYEELPEKSREMIFARICQLMEGAPAFTPGVADGKPVVSKYFLIKFQNHFVIKDHKVMDMDKNGDLYEL